VTPDIGANNTRFDTGVGPMQKAGTAFSVALLGIPDDKLALQCVAYILSGLHSAYRIDNYFGGASAALQHNKPRWKSFAPRVESVKSCVRTGFSEGIRMAPSVAAVIVAAGRGSRVGGALPKQYKSLAGEPVLRTTLSTFAWHGEIGAIQAVIHGDDRAHYDAAAQGLKVLPPVLGGATRQISVRHGLEALRDMAPDVVLIHDAARPFCSAELVSRAISACQTTGAAIPALEVTDTIKSVDAAGHVTGTVDRTTLRSVQTPQAFKFAPLLDAHRRAAQEGRDDFTDDAALIEWAGLKVAVFAGEQGNTKLTTEDDFSRAEARRIASLTDVRTGSGYDVHPFDTSGDHVWLGGVKIPHDRKLAGHSDADVALHAIVDAVLGAIADGDIGVHFPPSDMRWRGASSDQFLKYACERVTKRGGRIAHVDLTLVCETPRIGPHREAIRKRIAEICDLSIDRVGLQATTAEKLGFIGRGEGIVAMASATVRLPWSW
jgi:2-C-methyl-D-erythritol 4-phosphate cytidylyltransferase/2-C-methyl-D-erythritol 2,4-cyclodiphosphate synthase